MVDLLKFMLLSSEKFTIGHLWIKNDVIVLRIYGLWLFLFLLFDDL